MTNWPSHFDYQLAIQDPNQSLRDPELQSCQPVCDNWGLPVPSSGNFAIVFCLKHTGTRRCYAVRFFTRPVKTQQYRYQRLTEHLKQQPRSCRRHLVNFAYQHEGILVNGDWFPLIRMEWIEGQTLDQAISSALNDGKLDRLDKWIEQWRDLMQQLRQAHMGHGDLQHGNILVNKKGRLVLVDYDGIYIPCLDGNPPDEVGHPNYQHPQRIQHGYYGEKVDAFSALVIYLSLLAIKYDRSLWNKFHDDNCLIFQKNDFLAPGQTQIWHELQSLKDPEVQGLASALAEYCNQSPDQLPYPDEILNVPILIPIGGRPGDSSVQVGIGWLEGHTMAIPSATPHTGTQTVKTGGTEWLTDHLSKGPGHTFAANNRPGLVAGNRQQTAPGSHPYNRSALARGTLKKRKKKKRGCTFVPNQNTQVGATATASGQTPGPQRVNSVSSSSVRQSPSGPPQGEVGCVWLIIGLVVALVYAVARWLGTQ